MTDASFQATGPESNSRITLETKTLHSLDPKILAAFFSKEADALVRSIHNPNLDNRLEDVYRSVYEQTRHPMQSIVLLQSRADEFNLRRERIIQAAETVPELAQLVTDRTAETIAEEWHNTVDRFLKLKTGLLNRVQLYGVGSSSAVDHSGPRALNTRFSDFSDADRDVILKRAFEDDPNLAFWDINFGLKLLQLEHAQALSIANYIEDYKTKIAQSKTQQAPVSQLLDASRELYSIFADLPNTQVPTHLLESFRTTVENHFAERVARAFRPNSPK